MQGGQGGMFTPPPTVAMDNGASNLQQKRTHDGPCRSCNTCDGFVADPGWVRISGGTRCVQCRHKARNHGVLWRDRSAYDDRWDLWCDGCYCYSSGGSGGSGGNCEDCCCCYVFHCETPDDMDCACRNGCGACDGDTSFCEGCFRTCVDCPGEICSIIGDCFGSIGDLLGSCCDSLGSCDCLSGCDVDCSGCDCSGCDCSC